MTYTLNHFEPYLAHELWDDPVKGGALVPEPLLSGAQGPEIFGRFRNDVVAKFKNDSPQFLAVGRHVEVHLKKLAISILGNGNYYSILNVICQNLAFVVSIRCIGSSNYLQRGQRNAVKF